MSFSLPNIIFLYISHCWKSFCASRFVAHLLYCWTSLLYVFHYLKVTFTLVVCVYCCDLFIAWLCFLGWIEPENLWVYPAFGSTEVHTTRILSWKRYMYYLNWVCITESNKQFNKLAPPFACGRHIWYNTFVCFNLAFAVTISEKSFLINFAKN